MSTKAGIAAVLSAIVLCSVAQPSAAASEPEKPKKRKGMVVSAEHATGSFEMPVKRHHPVMLPKRPVSLMLEFGPYQVVDFVRGWTHASSSEAGTTQLVLVSADASQTYHFRLVSTEAPGDPGWSCTCAAVAATSTLGQSSESSELRIPLSGKGRLQCSLDPGDGSEPWRLDLEHGIKAGLIPAYHAMGSLASGDRVVTILGTDRLAQYSTIGAQRLTGFALYQGEQPVGAVDLFKPTVLIGPALPEDLRSAFVAASAALLLFEDLTKSPGEW